MEWLIALTPLAVATASAVGFFLADRRTLNWDPLPTSGFQPRPEPDDPPDRDHPYPPPPIRLVWQRRPALARPSSPTPTRPPAPSSFSGRFWADEPTQALERKSRVSNLPPIWSSFWGSNWPLETRSASDTLPLPRQSTRAPLAIPATPAWSASPAASPEPLFMNLERSYFTERNSRHAQPMAR